MVGNPTKKEVLIALGANLPSREGAPERTLAAALKALSKQGFSDLKCSEFYRTPCFPVGAGPDYVNAAASFTSDKDAESLLGALHAIEAEFGRERDQRWGQRTLDLDLVAIDQDIRPDLDTYEAWKDLDIAAQKQRAPDRLILPHPRVQDRAFVLVPLHDVAPDWQHPVLGLTVREMLQNIDAADLSQVVAI